MVLAGKERLKVLLRVDFVGWKTAPPGKQPEKGNSSRSCLLGGGVVQEDGLSWGSWVYRLVFFNLDGLN
jgi:hypothetical protein